MFISLMAAEAATVSQGNLPPTRPGHASHRVSERGRVCGCAPARLFGRWRLLMQLPATETVRSRRAPESRALPAPPPCEFDIQLVFT